MALETATHINDLVITNPAGGDDLSQGDDHLRMIKDVLKRDIPLTAPSTALGMSLLTAAAVSDVNTLLGFSQIKSIDYTLSGNALTLKLNPTNLDFRSTTLTSGAITNVSNASQITTTISSGSTGGTTSAVQSDIYILAINNSGTMELAWGNGASGLSINEEGVITTVAEGGAGAADSATTIYSTTARTGVAYRVVGLFRSTQTTAGAWAQAPTLVQGVGGLAVIPKRLLQSVTYQTGAVATGSTAIPGDNTIPQNTEGDQYLSLAITPTSATSLLEITVLAVVSNSASVNQTLALFQDSTANALAATFGFITATAVLPMPLTHYMTAGTTSATTFKVRSGGTAGQTTFNGLGAAGYLGGVMASRITIKEYAA